MPIPSYERMLRPLLAFAAERNITRQDMTQAVADHFKLTQEDREAKIPSGQATVVRNRVGWAMTFLTKGGLIEKVAPRTYRITERGRTFLAEHPADFTERDLAKLPGWKEAWHSTPKTNDKQEVVVKPTDGATPVEALGNAIAALNADLKTRLLNTILEQSPEFFERLVLDVLLAMGYGGSRENAAEHLGKSGDEGVDGRINQDPLGLDQIVVQAKRYAPDHVIDRKTIQAFVGSMTGQGVTKGIFITTSAFNANATEFVQRGSHTKVVLIDGEELLNLMLRHHIGVRVEQKVEVLDIDQNYFNEEE
jgi:restriction system protein